MLNTLFLFPSHPSMPKHFVPFLLNYVAHFILSNGDYPQWGKDKELLHGSMMYRPIKEVFV